MFSQIANWLSIPITSIISIGRIKVNCSYCGNQDFVYRAHYNPNTIYCCSNTCSYQYYDKFCNPASPYYKKNITRQNSQSSDMVEIQIA